MSPDSPRRHRYPLSKTVALLTRALPDPPWCVIPEPGLAPSVIWKVGVGLLGPSQLGPRIMAPDLAVFEGEPEVVHHGGEDWAFELSKLRLAVEFLSKRTYRTDLGVLRPRGGGADEVDRWASWLSSGVPELWIVNAGLGPPCPVPPRSGLFLRNAGDVWVPLEVEGAVHADVEHRGHRPVVAGRVRSGTGAVLDLEPFWERVQLHGPPG